MQRLAQFSLSAILALGCVLSALAKQITSDSGVKYLPGQEEMGWVTKVSNTVMLTTDAALDFELLGEETVELERGGVAQFPHRLRYFGTTPASFRMSAVQYEQDNFDLSDVELVQDLNKNGQADTGEPVITFDTLIQLQPGEELSLAVRGNIPMSGETSEWARLMVTVWQLGTGSVLSRFDTVKLREMNDGAGIFVEKLASRTIAEVGESIEYTVRVRNVTEQTLTQVRLTDALPEGFLYDKHTLRINEGLQPDPGVKEGVFSVELGAIASGDFVTVRYRTHVGVLALRGDGINRASATGSMDNVSNIAQVRVKVTDGAFTDKSVVIGRVFVDANGNGAFDSNDVSVPGVRLYLEDGTFVLTDIDGKYSFYGLRPRTHVLKIDSVTLPSGAVPLVTANRQAFDADSRFLDLKRFELHKANFALSATDATMMEIEARRVLLGHGGSEISRGVKTRLTADGTVESVADRKALPSSGLIGESVESSPAKKAQAAGGANETVVSKGDGLPAATEAALVALDNKLGFVGLTDGEVLATSQINVCVKGPLGARFTLWLNDIPVSEDRIGSRATLAQQQTEVLEFIGIDLTGGANRLKVTMSDSFGNVRGSRSITVTAPDKFAVVKITPPLAGAVADGTSPAFITVEMLDENGVLIAARTPLTLEASLGDWQVDDCDPAAPGVQVFVEGGRRSFPLMSPVEPGTCDLRASSGLLESKASFAFLPNLRPIMAVGVIEGTLNVGSRGVGAIHRVSVRDAFDDELRVLSETSSNGKIGGGARAAFFLKGKIRGDCLLTASFDSEKADGERLFRDIQPGEFYPVYGDSSVRGYEAQSTGKLYVRIDKNRSYLLVGDFSTQAQTTGTESAITLGNYQRSLNGVKEHYEDNRVRANVWASQDSTRQLVLEVAANGTSGPYGVGLGSAVVNSERVEIITRDREQPSRVIATKLAARFFDYEFEPWTGRLVFKAPVPSLDADLNPISIRITCEVESGGKEFWIYGADAQVDITSRLTASTSYARADDPFNRYELGAVGATYKLAERTTITSEVAQSRSEFKDAGLATRVEFKHETDRLRSRVFASEVDADFDNSSSFLLPGRIEGGFDLAYKLTKTTSFIGRGVYTENLANNGVRQGVQADIEQAIGAWKVLVGARYSDETAAPASASTREVAPNTVNSLRARVTAPVPLLKRATTYGEYEQDVNESAKKVAAAGFDYAFASGGRVYARHEFLSSLGSVFSLNEEQRRHATVVGLERDYMKNGQVFNEYRASNEIDGRDAQAALGLRNLWSVADGVRATTRFEQVTPVRGEKRDRSTAVTGAIEYERRDDWRADARLEFRNSTTSDSVLNTLAYARQINDDWTFLAKSIALFTTSKGFNEGDTNQGRLQTGFAWRPKKSDRWNGLGKYEFKRETDNHAKAVFSQRSAHMFNGDLNYDSQSRWTLSGHYATKFVHEEITPTVGDYSAHLVGTRAGFTLSRRWDIGLNAFTLIDGSNAECFYAVGPEVGFLVGKNFNFGFGYNVGGIRDRDLATDGSTGEGFFIRLRLKFDEKSLPKGARRGKA